MADFRNLPERAVCCSSSVVRNKAPLLRNTTTTAAERRGPWGATALNKGKLPFHAPLTRRCCVPVCCFPGAGERAHGNTIAYMPAGSLHTTLTTARGKERGVWDRSQNRAHNRPLTTDLVCVDPPAPVGPPSRFPGSCTRRTRGAPRSHGRSLPSTCQARP